MPVTFEHRPQPKTSHPKVDKPKKINHNRSGPSQRELGAISDKVREEVHERSGRICEVRVCCHGTHATEQAHDQSRNTIKHKTTAEDLLDACNACHRFLDRTDEGIRLRRRIKEMGGATEYIRRRNDDAKLHNSIRTRK